MKDYIGKVLHSFEFDSIPAFYQSLCPSLKYNLLSVPIVLSAISSYVEMVFGFNGLCLVAFTVMMIVETATGLAASRKRKEDLNSTRMSRFSLKMGAYCACLFVTNSFHDNFLEKGQALPATAMGYAYLYLVMHIVVENVISVLENLAEIQGKPKTHYIDRIKKKLKDF